MASLPSLSLLPGLLFFLQAVLFWRLLIIANRAKTGLVEERRAGGGGCKYRGKMEVERFGDDKKFGIFGVYKYSWHIGKKGYLEVWSIEESMLSRIR